MVPLGCPLAGYSMSGAEFDWKGAVGSRPMPWTSLCCSELHRCFPVFLPVGLPGAPASSTRLPTWFVIGQRDVVTLQLVYSLGEWQFSRGFATILQCFLVRTATHCGSFRNDDVLTCPEQFCSWYFLRTCFLWRSSTGTVANAMTVFALKLSLHVVQLCGYWQVSRWLCPHNGWLHLPYETTPVWFLVGNGMFGSRSLAFLLPHCHCWPPLPGGFWFLGPMDLWSQLTVKRMTITFMKAHYELTW